MKTLGESHPREFEEIFKLLKAADTILDKSELFREFGKAGPGEGGAEAQIYAKARALVAKDAAPTFEQAVEKVLDLEPELYEKAEEERQERIARRKGGRKMPTEEPVYSTSVVAGMDLSDKQFHAVKLSSSGQMVLSGAGENALGILQDDPESGRVGQVMCLGKSFAIYGATVAAETPSPPMPPAGLSRPRVTTPWWPWRQKPAWQARSTASTWYPGPARDRSRRASWPCPLSSPSLPTETR